MFVCKLQACDNAVSVVGLVPRFGGRQRSDDGIMKKENSIASKVACYSSCSPEVYFAFHLRIP